MANVKFLSGSYAQYSALAAKDANTLYFVDGQLFKGDVAYTDQIVVVPTFPSTRVAGKIYVNTDTNSVLYYDGHNVTAIVPEIVGSIEEGFTKGSTLANVKAIQDFVAAKIAEIPAQTDYTVTLTDEVVGTGEKSKQTLKQGKSGSEKEIGTIVVPDLKMEVKATPNDGYLKTYQFTYGTGTTFEVDIPKDLVVESGEVITVTDGSPVSGLTNGTYLKLVIVNQAEPIYIDVKDLCDVYTGKTVTDGVSVSISDTNEISATLVGKAVAESNLTDDLANKINGLESSLTWGSIV